MLLVFSGRLQVSSFFVELGPAAPRSPASCRAAMSLKALFLNFSLWLRESTGSESLSQEAGSAPPERGVARRCFGWRRSGWAGAQGGSWAALKFEIPRFLGASSGRRPSAPAQSSRRAGWRSQFNRRRQSSRRLDHRTRTHFF